MSCKGNQFISQYRLNLTFSIIIHDYSEMEISWHVTECKITWVYSITKYHQQMSSIECTIVLKYFLEYDHAMRNNVSAAFENLFNVRINKGDTLRVRSNFSSSDSYGQMACLAICFEADTSWEKILSLSGDVAFTYQYTNEYAIIFLRI